MDPMEAVIANVGNFFYHAQMALVADKAVLIEKTSSNQLVFSKPMINLMETTHSAVASHVAASGMSELQVAYFNFMADHVRYTLNQVLAGLGRNFSPQVSIETNNPSEFYETRNVYETESSDTLGDEDIDYSTVVGQYLNNDITSAQKFLDKHYAHYPDVSEGLTECNGLGDLQLGLWEEEVTADLDEFFLLDKLTTSGELHLPEDFFHERGCTLCDYHRHIQCRNNFTNRIAIYLEHYVANDKLEVSVIKDIYRHFFYKDRARKPV